MSRPETQARNLTLPRGKHSPELTQGWRQGCTALMYYHVGMQCDDAANFEGER